MGLLLTLPAALLLGLLLEALVFRHLYGRDHLSQVLATFGVILTVDEAVRAVWGSAPLPVLQPAGLEGGVELMPGFIYPVYRLAVIGAGLGVALLLWALVERTRIGMLVRAGATHPATVSALGVNIRRLFMAGVRVRRDAGRVCRGAGGAGVRGGAGHGRQRPDPRLRGHRDRRHRVHPRRVHRGVAGGLLDTLGRSMLPDLLRLVMQASSARQTGAALASMLVYVVMAAILCVRPAGLFPVRRT